MSEITLTLDTGVYTVDTEDMDAIVQTFANSNVGTLANIISIRVYGDESYASEYTHRNLFELMVILGDISPGCATNWSMIGECQ